MNEEFRYIPYNDDDHIKDLINNGNIYNIGNSEISGLMPQDYDSDQIEADRDTQYFDEMYSGRIKDIKRYVNEACDRLEYEGSPMFAEYPDKETILRIASEIYNKLDEDEKLESYYEGSSQDTGRQVAAAYDPYNEYEYYYYDNRMSGHGYRNYNWCDDHTCPPYVPRRRCKDCDIKNIIGILLCNEFCCRRNRYRRHRRRFY